MNVLVAVALAFGLLLPAFSTSAPAASAAQGGTCRGAKTRTVRYAASNNTAYVEGCDSTWSLTEVASRLDGIKAAKGKLRLVDAGNKIWYLGANLRVMEGATLGIVGGAQGDANQLRLKSDGDGFVFLRSDNGTLLIQDTTVTSWDEGKNSADEEYSDGRAYVTVRSAYNPGAADRPATTPTACTVNGGTRDYYEGRMDIIRSTMTHLGYKAAESYGVVWKVIRKELNPSQRDDALYNAVDVFGNVYESRFQNNYFGAYTYGAYCQDWASNVFERNVEYGLDPHDDSDFMTARGNIFRSNGNHGFICSVYCNDLKVLGNTSHDNGKRTSTGPIGHGIMLHRNVNGALVQGNNVYNNADSGIAIFDSHGATVRNNSVRNNGRAAVRLSVGASRNRIFNNILIGRSARQVGEGYVVYTYKGSDVPTSGNGRPKFNTFLRNRMIGHKEIVLKIGQGTSNHFIANRVFGPNVGFQFTDGYNNLVSGIVFGLGLDTHVSTIGEGTNASTFVRNGQVGRKLVIRLNERAFTQLRDTRSYVYASRLRTAALPRNTQITLSYANSGPVEVVRTLDFRVRPQRGAVYVKPSRWQTAAPYRKSWTERTRQRTGAVAHRVGNLQAGTCYKVAVNGRRLTRLKANRYGRILFTYSGGYASPRAFEVSKTTGCQ